MKKVLFISNSSGFSIFNAPYMEWFKKIGWQVDNASPGRDTGEVDNQYDIAISRSPLSFSNIKAYKALKEIIDREKYDIIHVHTPMGAVLGRLAARSARKIGCKVIYTAHGFHFFKGAPLKNWLLYYPIEKLLAKYTDALVTINKEDYKRAIKGNLAAGPIYHIDGVGVNLEKFHRLTQEETVKIRTSLNLKSSDFVGLFIGQFIKRKNHVFLIEALPEIIKRVPHFKMVFAGSGDTLDSCKALAKSLGVEAATLFLGPRNDIPDLCGMADIHISSSVQEGLAVGNMEAMATGKPLVISDIRGHQEVCDDGFNGFLFKLGDKEKLIESIVSLAEDSSLYSKMSANSLVAVQKFEVGHEVERMAQIYMQLLS